jgi:hypothetical protein
VDDPRELERGLWKDSNASLAGGVGYVVYPLRRTEGLLPSLKIPHLYLEEGPAGRGEIVRGCGVHLNNDWLGIAPGEGEF